MIIGLTLLGGGFLENLMSITSFQSQKSFYLSESGAQDALLKIARNKDITTGGSSPPITEGSDTLNFTIFGTTIKTINSSANVGNKLRDIQETVSVSEDGLVIFDNWQETAE